MALIRNARTGTHPIVLHATGRNGRLGAWALLAHEVLAILDQTPRVPPANGPDFAFLTWSTLPQSTILERCCAALGANVNVARIPDPDIWQNVIKIGLTLDFLRKAEAEYVVGLDAFDVLLVDHPAEIVRRFRERFEPQGHKLVFNASCRPWPGRREAPDVACWDFELTTFPAQDRHLNAGCWVGRTDYAREFWAAAAALVAGPDWPRAYRHSEQVALRTIAFPARYPEIMIDTSCSIFQHMESGKHDLEALDERLTSQLVRR